MSTELKDKLVSLEDLKVAYDALKAQILTTDSIDLPVGSVVTLGYLPLDGAASSSCTSTTRGIFVKSPSDIGYAGAWEFTDKDFKPLASSTESDWFAPNSTNVSSTDLRLLRAGKTINIGGAITLKVAASDNDTTLGTLITDYLGVDSIQYNFRNVAGDDIINSVAPTKISSTGTWVITDYVSRATSLPTTTSHSITPELTMQFLPYSMLDSACNKFYWTRIA